jgi:tetratricopeptide (TPR) repeat protein
MGADSLLIVLGVSIASASMIQHRSPSANQRWTKHVKAGNALMQEGRLDDAELEFRQAIDALDGINASDLRRASALTQLSVINQSQGQLEEAARQIKAALSILEHEPATPPKTLATILIAYAGVYLSMNDLDTAVPLSARAVKFCEAQLPPDAPELALAIGQQGLISMYGMHMDEAKIQLSRALELAEANPNGRPGTVGRCMTVLAQWHHLNGDIAQAEGLYRRGIKEIEASLPPYAPDLASAREGLQLLLQEGELEVERPGLEGDLTVPLAP